MAVGIFSKAQPPSHQQAGAGMAETLLYGSEKQGSGTRAQLVELLSCKVETGIQIPNTRPRDLCVLSALDHPVEEAGLTPETLSSLLVAPYTSTISQETPTSSSS